MATEEPRTDLAERPQVEEAEEEDGGGPVKSFLDHLEDLRWTLIKSVVAIGLGMLVCLISGQRVVELLKRPLNRAPIKFHGTNPVVRVLLGTNLLGSWSIAPLQAGSLDLSSNRIVTVILEPVKVGTNDLLAVRRSDSPGPDGPRERSIELINLTPIGGFYVAFQVAMYGGLVLAAPFVLFFVGDFVVPALKRKEKRYFFRGLAFGGVLFMTGVSFCYFVLMPLALSASVKYSEWLGFGAYQWRAEDYVSFVCKFMLGMGLGFEMPVVILTLVKIGLLNYTMLSKFRRYMVVINLVLGAVLTTPEVLTQVMMFFPLQLLYELSVWVAWYWERQDRKRAAAAGEQAI